MAARCPLPVLATLLTACTSVLLPPAAPEATTATRGRCAIVVARPGGDWSRWNEQVCGDASGPDTQGPPEWLAPLVARAVDDAELAGCGALRCAARERAVRLYVIPSCAPSLTSHADDEKIAIVLSSALVDRVGRDGGFYELAFAHEVAHLRLGATCGEGVQSDDRLRELACDREALRWLAGGKHRDDEEWAQRVKILTEARTH
jgi:hypothetical protein